MSTPAQLTNVTQQERSTEEKERVVSPLEPWSDKAALDIMKRDFEFAEQWRNQNHDSRFRSADRVYLAFRPRKTWEGTKIPRASMPVYLAFGQVQALKPAIMDALFADDPPFGVVPHGDGTWQQVGQVRELIRHQMQGLDERGIMSLRQLVSDLLDFALIYGNGILEWGWLAKKIQRIEYTRRMNPRMSAMMGPDGQPAFLPTGEYDLSVSQQQVEHTINRPQIQLTDIRDFYIDPHCHSSNVQDARYCFTRHWRTVEQVASWRGQPGFDIPEDDVLRKMAEEKSTGQGDNTKAQQESMRGNSYSPQQDYTEDPSQKRIEVIRGWRKDRHVWLLNRKWVAHNQPNCYMALPFLNINYVNVPGRFYGLSICDLVEGDQDMIADLLEGRLDEVSLNIHAPIVRQRGSSNIPPSARRMRPGVVWETDGEPSKSIMRLPMGNVTQDVHIEADAGERRVQKTTGVTDTGMMGIATAGGNSANRTATGINTQSAAASRRVQFLVETLEDQLMEPLCNILLALDKRFLNPEEIIAIIGQNGQQLEIDPLNVLNASVKFEFRASSKMKTRQAVQSGGLQMVLESVANPAFLEMQAKQGFQLNTPTLSEVLADGLNMRAMDWFVPIQPEVQQAMNQPTADQVIRQQMQQERLAAESEGQAAQQDTDLMGGMISKLITPDAAHAALGLPPQEETKAKNRPKPKPKAAKK